MGEPWTYIYLVDIWLQPGVSAEMPSDSPFLHKTKYANAWKDLYSHYLDNSFLDANSYDLFKGTQASEPTKAFQAEVVMAGEDCMYQPLYILILDKNCVYYNKKPVVDHQANITKFDKFVHDELNKNNSDLISVTVKTILNDFESRPYDDGDVQRFSNLFQSTPVWNNDDVRGGILQRASDAYTGYRLLVEGGVSQQQWQLVPKDVRYNEDEVTNNVIGRAFHNDVHERASAVGGLNTFSITSDTINILTAGKGQGESITINRPVYSESKGKAGTFGLDVLWSASTPFLEAMTKSDLKSLHAEPDLVERWLKADNNLRAVIDLLVKRGIDYDQVYGMVERMYSKGWSKDSDIEHCIIFFGAVSQAQWQRVPPHVKYTNEVTCSMIDRAFQDDINQKSVAGLSREIDEVITFSDFAVDAANTLTEITFTRPCYRTTNCDRNSFGLDVLWSASTEFLAEMAGNSLQILTDNTDQLVPWMNCLPRFRNGDGILEIVEKRKLDLSLRDKCFGALEAKGFVYYPKSPVYVLSPNRGSAGGGALPISPPPPPVSEAERTWVNHFIRGLHCEGLSDNLKSDFTDVRGAVTIHYSMVPVGPVEEADVEWALCECFFDAVTRPEPAGDKPACIYVHEVRISKSRKARDRHACMLHLYAKEGKCTWAYYDPNGLRPFGIYDRDRVKYDAIQGALEQLYPEITHDTHRQYNCTPFTLGVQRAMFGQANGGICVLLVLTRCFEVLTADDDNGASEARFKKSAWQAAAVLKAYKKVNKPSKKKKKEFSFDDLEKYDVTRPMGWMKDKFQLKMWAADDDNQARAAKMGITVHEELADSDIISAVMAVDPHVWPTAFTFCEIVPMWGRAEFKQFKALTSFGCESTSEVDALKYVQDYIEMLWEMRRYLFNLVEDTDRGLTPQKTRGSSVELATTAFKTEDPKAYLDKVIFSSAEAKSFMHHKGHDMCELAKTLGEFLSANPKIDRKRWLIQSPWCGLSRKAVKPTQGLAGTNSVIDRIVAKGALSCAFDGEEDSDDDGNGGTVFDTEPDTKFDKFAHKPTQYDDQAALNGQAFP